MQLYSVTKDVIFHDVATIAADGTEQTVGGYKTLTIEIYGTSTSRSISFFGKGASGTVRAITGVNLSDISTGTGTSGTGEIWTFDVTGLTSVLIDLTAVAGGNVSIKGTLVA
jgi:hypothetical protein